MVGCHLVEVAWKGFLRWFGNHFGCHPHGVRKVFSLFVPSRVGFRAGSTVGATVGFFAFLQPKQNAYTKVALSRTVEFRPYVNTCRVQVGWGYLYPQSLLHNDLNAPTYPEYSANILGHRSFYRLECTNCLLYPIRARDAIPKVLCNLRICAGPLRALLIL